MASGTACAASSLVCGVDSTGLEASGVLEGSTFGTANTPPLPVSEGLGKDSNGTPTIAGALAIGSAPA